MGRIQFFELLDLPWWPRVFRNGCTSYLQWISSKLNIFYVAPPIIVSGLKNLKSPTILDLGSGAGGPWLSFYQEVLSSVPNCKIILSDKYPNRDGVSLVDKIKHANLTYKNESVDALKVNIESQLLRTQFFSFHHFNPVQAKSLLSDTMKREQGILIFDGSSKDKWKGILSSPLIFFMTLLSSPFWKPFKKSNLLFSLFPIIPLSVMFDGIVSYLRFYSKKELEEIISEADPSGSYQWKVEDVKTKYGWITYMSGFPIEKDKVMKA